MRLKFEPTTELPRLAWAACVREKEPVVRILHGPWVETQEDCFFEGAWDGAFHTGRFDQSETLAGSGGRIAEGGVLFAGPSHTFERLYSIRGDGELHVSNSLAFVLAMSGERLDAAHRHYHLDFLDFNRAGISVKEKRLRLAGPRFLELHDCCNLVVGADLSITREEKPLGVPPRCYHEYVSFLAKTLEDVLANASDRGRRQRYRPVTMLSQGYDSVAVSALAARAGCREAVSFLKSNSARGYVDDSGREIAPYLGLELTEYERTDYERLAGRCDDEFYIEPDGIDRYLALMEGQLTGSVLLSGRFAERLWELERCRRVGLPGDTGSPSFEMFTCFKLGGCALGEFRLRAGFLNFPLACAGGLHARAVRAITESKEMKPWSVGGGYNRPIARRVAEEAGVPRHLFGQIKKGGPLRCERRTWAGRLIYSAWDFANLGPIRHATLRLTGNLFNPAWRRGSLEVQRGVQRITERYRAAISHTASHSTCPMNLI